MVLPHAEVAFEGPLINVEEVMVGGNAPSGVNVSQGFELRELRLRQHLGLPDQVRHFVFPVSEQTLPVAVVVESPLLELLGATSDLGRVADGVTPDVNAPIDNAIVNAKRRR